MAQVRTRKRGKIFSYIFKAGKVVEKGGFVTRDATYKAGVAAYNDFIHGNIMSESIISANPAVYIKVSRNANR